MQQLRPGLWTWTAHHPDWPGPEDGWGPVVRSYALDTDSALVLVDPLAPPSLTDDLAGGKEAAVVLTVWEHERSADECVARLGARVYAPHGSLQRLAVAATGFGPGDALPGGVEAHTGFFASEATLWIPAHAALVTGDVLLGEGELRVAPDDWFEGGHTREEVRQGLAPLLELPVELVLPTHGEPIVEDARARLEAAIGPLTDGAAR